MTTQVHRNLRKLRQVSSNSPQTKSVKAVIEDEFGYDFDPLIELVKLAKSTNNDMVAAKCYAQVCKYCYPQIKSVEMKNATLHKVVLTDMELVNRFRQYMEKQTCINNADITLKKVNSFWNI